MREAAKTGQAVPIETAPRAPGRAFLQGALAERSPAALVEGFRAAIAAEGMTRHFCVRDHAARGLELLACDYPFDPTIVAELGGLRFEFEGLQGERVAVTVAGAAAGVDPGRRARLHGYAMLYAACLPALIAAGELRPEGTPLEAEERLLLERLLLGESEGDIAAATGEPLRNVAMRIGAACSKLGVSDARGAIVVAAQRGFLNNLR